MAAFCKICGNSMADGARFCAVCGTAATPAAGPAGYAPSAPRSMVRPRVGRMVAGVCQGIANQYGWDVAWVRVLTVILAVFGGGIGVVAYVVLWVVTPEEPFALPPGQSFPQGS